MVSQESWNAVAVAWYLYRSVCKDSRKLIPWCAVASGYHTASRQLRNKKWPLLIFPEPVPYRAMSFYIIPLSALFVNVRPLSFRYGKKQNNATTSCIILRKTGVSGIDREEKKCLNILNKYPMINFNPSFSSVTICRALFY